MIRHLVIMFLLSILFGLIRVSQKIAIFPDFADKPTTYLIGYVAGNGVVLFVLTILISIVVIFVVRFFCWVFNQKKTAPDKIILGWSVWTMIIILNCIGSISYPGKDIGFSPSASTEHNQPTAVKVYHHVEHSVYSIESMDKDGGPFASGGAVAVTNDLLATNCHIIEEADHFTVKINNEDKRGIIYSHVGDLCIVSVPGEQFTPVNMRQSSELRIGEDVYAIGNPERHEKSISRGILSNKIKEDNITMLQTDAAISPGSSGGGLFDHNAYLIGITTKKLVEENDEGIGLVIPTEIIEEAIASPKLTSSVGITKNNSGVQDSKRSTDKSRSGNTIIGVYGSDHITLFKHGTLCLMAFAGKSKEGDARSILFWSPFSPKLFFAFPNLNSIDEATETLSRYFKDKNDLETTQNILKINNLPYQLSGEISNSSSYDILTAMINKDPVEALSKESSLSANFTDSNEKEGYSTDYYGMNGFKDALAAYQKQCNDE